MRTINDSNEKLLKMKESLIKVTTDYEKLKSYIEDYLKIATEIDKCYFDKLISDICAYDKEKPLQEQYKQLDIIDDEYDELLILQNRIRNICDDYVETNLSDLSIIHIDEIRKRMNDINGYLVNLSNIEKLKEESLKLNKDLFDQNKVYSQNKKMISTLESELSRFFINAEGRIINESSGYEYPSMIKEYKDIDVDITKINGNIDLLEQKIITAEEVKKEREELLRAAKICYTTIPNNENMNTTLEIEKDTCIARYNLCLLKIAKLIFLEEVNCDRARHKREELVDLIDYRKGYLSELDINYYVDHMQRVKAKISQQLEVLDRIGDNTKEAFNINKKMKEVSEKLDLLNQTNGEYLSELEKDAEFISHDVPSIETIIEEKEDDTSYEMKRVLDNQVVKISDYLSDFNIARVDEKVRNVINRVNKMITNNEDEVVEKEESPELFISPVIDESNIELEVEEKPQVLPEEIKEDDLSFDTKDFPIFEDLSYADNNDVSNNNEEAPEIEDTIPVEVPLDLDISPEKVKTEISDDDLFQDINPFNDVVLFNDKKDDEIIFPSIEEEKSEENNTNNDSDIFWNVPFEIENKEENFDVQSSDLSFLEINNKEKVKKKVA